MNRGTHFYIPFAARGRMHRFWIFYRISPRDVELEGKLFGTGYRCSIILVVSENLFLLHASVKLTRNHLVLDELDHFLNLESRDLSFFCEAFKLCL